MNSRHLFKVFIFLMAFPVESSTFKIPVNGVNTRVTALCFDNGFIRRVDGPDYNRPVVSRENIQLGNNKSFQKHNLISSKYRYYDLKKKQFVIHTITECETSLMSNKVLNQSVEKRNSTEAESLFYGNLYNNGVKSSVTEDWKKLQGLEDYLKSKKDSTKIYLYSENINSKRLDSYNDWLKVTEKYVGGEQSGGGNRIAAGIESSKLYKINLNISPSSFKRTKLKRNTVERLFKVNSKLENVLFKDKKLPKSLFYLKEVRK